MPVTCDLCPLNVLEFSQLDYERHIAQRTNDEITSLQISTTNKYLNVEKI